MEPPKNLRRSNMQRTHSKDIQDIIHSVLFGIINAIMCIPVMISFASIIFRDDAFREVLPSIVKIVLFSCMIHQIAFSVFSGLTFAVGQVQDAGLIFLSSMASSVVSGCASPNSIVPTTLVVLSTYTALLGVMLILLGKMKLASVVQYLPLPVIGGYLAYIGFFCGQAGLAMMAGVEINSPSDWSRLCNRRSILLILPGLLLGSAQYVILRTVKSAFTLPACMATVLLAFYFSLWTFGMSMGDAREYGWISALAPEVPFYEAWDLFRFDRVEVALVLPQFPKFIAMVLVVAFSSSLDVAAIEMELGLPLDYNRELQTVGISNLFSGLTGGYTGSYIFSQTLFSLRRGVKSRVAGAVLALVELSIIALPISVPSYLPKLFFGSMLVLISTDLMWEWLVMAAAKMMGTEYVVCLATFVSIMIMGIETGMAIGVLLSMISFVVVYAKLPALSSSSLLLRSSTVVRSYEERCALLSRANRGKIVTISLKGYVFFGSAVKILEEVKSRVILTPSATDGPTPSASRARRARGSNAGESDEPAPAPTPMFSFLMSHKEEQTDARGEDLEMKDEGLNWGRERDCQAEREREGEKERERGYRAIKMTSNALEPMASKTSASSSSRSMASKGNTSVFAAYAPLASSSKKSFGDNQYDSCAGDEDTMLDEEMGRIRSRSRSRSKDAGSGLPHRSKSIPMVSPTNSITSSVAPYEGQGQRDRERDRAESLLVGSPLQFLSAYDMDQDTLSSYQKRWTFERDQPGPHHLHSTLTPSSSTHSLSQSRPVAFSPPDKPLIGPRDEKSSSKNCQESGIAAGSERSGHWTGAGSSVELHPRPTHDAVSSGQKASALSSSLASFACMSSERSKQQQHQHQQCQDIAETALPVKPATRTKSMSQLLSSSTSLTSGSILSAVWSSQERRRERVKLLSSPRAVRPNASESAKDGEREKDKERRSKSYDSLSAAVSYHIGDIEAADTSIEAPNPPSADFDSNAVPLPAPPLVLPPNPLGAQPACRGPETEPTEFLILDFSEVLGIDATSARSCFLMLVQLMRSSDVTVVFAAMSPGMEKLLTSHGVIRTAGGRDGDCDEADIVIDTADGALEWCENQILAGGRRGGLGPVLPRSSNYYSGEGGGGGGGGSLKALRRILQEHLEIEVEEEEEEAEEGKERHSLSPHSLLDTRSLGMYFTREESLQGEVVFDVGQRADKVYFIEEGCVEILLAAEGPWGRNAAQSERVNKISVGGIFGEAAFFLDLPHSVRCVSLTPKCVLWTLDRNSYMRMEISHPSLCLLVQHALLKSLSISSTSALHALHPSAAYSIMFE